MPTSPIGTRSSGYTLIEVLVVMLVLAGVGVAIPFASGTFSSANKLRTASMQLRADLMTLHADAIKNGRQSALTLASGGEGYKLIPAGTTRQLPAGMSITLLSADFAAARPATGSILFFPDGIAEGARITLALQGAERHLNVSWPTGTVQDDME